MRRMQSFLGAGRLGLRYSENVMIDAPETLQPFVPNADGEAGNGDAISLSLADLLPDSGGAIVIEGDGLDLSIRIMTDEPVIDAGVVETLVTATGEDVSCKMRVMCSKQQSLAVAKHAGWPADALHRFAQR